MIHFITIVLDGMPFITCHLPVFNKLSIPWRWHIVEGVADTVGCTSWCRKISPRLSSDGTTQYINSIKTHPNVSIYQKDLWNGKLEMVNAPSQHIKEGDVVMEIDSDEIWTARQIETIDWLFKLDDGRNAAAFFCRYFIGPNLVITSQDGYGNKSATEWRRAWRAGKKFAFERHEPPKTNDNEVWIGRDETRALGLVFDHYAYATEAQVAFKEQYYGYKNAVMQWRRLQSTRNFPVKANDFLSWIKEPVVVDKI